MAAGGTAGRAKGRPDRQHLVTADFCATLRQRARGVADFERRGRADPVLEAGEAWTDAVATWKSRHDRVDYTPVGAAAPKSLDCRLAAPDWSRAPAR
jgi:hypothetical protein